MPANSKGLDFYKPSGEPIQQLSGIQSLASCFSTAAGSFMITGALNSTIVVNDVGFQPKALLLWANGRTEAVDTSGRRTHPNGYGDK
jgi:hypothetical protein